MAVLVGTLMSVGHLAADQEVTALKACGVSLYRLTRPLLAIGTAITLVMVAYNHFVLPETNHRLRGRLFEIHQLRPTLQIKPNTFAEISDEYTLFVRFKDDRSGRLEDVILYKREGRGDPSPDVIVAEFGQLIALGPGRIQLELYNGEYHRLPDPTDVLAYNRTKFVRQTFSVELDPGGGLLQRSEQRGEREMNVVMLREAMSDQRAQLLANAERSREDLGWIVDAYAVANHRGSWDLDPRRSALDEYRSLLARAERSERSLALKAQLARGHQIREGRYAVELHKKFSIPVACMVFVVLGVPLAVTSARGGRGVSVGLSLLAFLIYYLFLTGGEKLADRGRLAPWLAMWAPNIVLGSGGVMLLYHSVQETHLIRFEAPRWWPRRWKKSRS
jgi:lipopolysaccharide export system permease protein